MHPTERPPDAGDSAPFSRQFLRFYLFRVDGFVVPTLAQAMETVSSP